ncbi:hypothetical protein DLAC_08102 [Tieghemostelium lacteum]|uniref:Uncharacterized protein n=1 Tax=Tieghemostelium lacteum TaxID=361077 RepID=A0A151ZB73_TIELA|nr:hypothetical protein DLAC_08102 [Tieghemostelium lacteum]|eukprot:KYQ91186.1 hypothetical protein DLAC_08102 [Tieghemostelium lacteum]
MLIDSSREIKDYTKSWKDLEKIIFESRLHELGRKDAVQESMLEHMVWVRSNYLSIKDYILSKVFQFPLEDVIVDHENIVCGDCTSASSSTSTPVMCNGSSGGTSTEELDNSSQRVVQIKKRVVRDEGIKQRLVIRPNDFPYSCEEPISHWILWCLKPMSFDEAKQYLSKFFNRTHGVDYLFFVNPHHLQSIKEVFHYHVFLKNLNENEVSPTIVDIPM